MQKTERADIMVIIEKQKTLSAIIRVIIENRKRGVRIYG